MSGEITDAAAAESSTADPSATPAPEPQNGNQADANVPFHQHPRFRELIAQNNERGNQIQTQAQQIQQLQRQLTTMQQNAPPQGAAPNEEYVKAADALLKIMEVNPRLKTLLGLADAAPRLNEGYQSVQELRQAQTASLLQSGRNHIGSLAEKSGIPADERALTRYEAMVTDHIQRTPGALDAFRQGDLRPVEEAMKDVAEFIGALRRPAVASVAQTKDKVRSLPPAPRGGLPSGSAPVKLDPNNPRAFEQDMHQRGMAKLSELLQG